MRNQSSRTEHNPEGIAKVTKPWQERGEPRVQSVFKILLGAVFSTLPLSQPFFASLNYYAETSSLIISYPGDQ